MALHHTIRVDRTIIHLQQALNRPTTIVCGSPLCTVPFTWEVLANSQFNMWTTEDFVTHHPAQPPLDPHTKNALLIFKIPLRDKTTGGVIGLVTGFPFRAKPNPSDVVEEYPRTIKRPQRGMVIALFSLAGNGRTIVLLVYHCSTPLKESQSERWTGRA